MATEVLRKGGRGYLKEAPRPSLTDPPHYHGRRCREGHAGIRSEWGGLSPPAVLWELVLNVRTCGEPRHCQMAPPTSTTSRPLNKQDR